MLSEPSQLCCAKSPVRNFVLTVPVESSQEELVFVQIVPEPLSEIWLMPSKIRMYVFNKWTASSEFGTYRLCEERRFGRACASAQSRQNLRCSLIQAMNQEERSDRKPDPWPLWMAEHAQLNVFMMECSKTQIRLTDLKWQELEMSSH